MKQYLTRLKCHLADHVFCQKCKLRSGPETHENACPDLQLSLLLEIFFWRFFGPLLKRTLLAWTTKCALPSVQFVLLHALFFGIFKTLLGLQRLSTWFSSRAFFEKRENDVAGTWLVLHPRLFGRLFDPPSDFCPLPETHEKRIAEFQIELLRYVLLMHINAKKIKPPCRLSIRLHLGWIARKTHRRGLDHIASPRCFGGFRVECWILPETHENAWAGAWIDLEEGVDFWPSLGRLRWARFNAKWSKNHRVGPRFKWEVQR